MLKRVPLLFLICFVLLICGCSPNENDSTRTTWRASDYIDPTDYEGIYSDGYDEGRFDGYEEGYEDGFDAACAIIIDRMDPEYREKWWEENIDDITKYGIEY